MSHPDEPITDQLFGALTALGGELTWHTPQGNQAYATALARELRTHLHHLRTRPPGADSPGAPTATAVMAMTTALVNALSATSHQPPTIGAPATPGPPAGVI